MNKVCATIIALASVFAVCAAMASAAVTTSATDEYCYNFTNKTIAVTFDNDLTGELSTTLIVKDHLGSPVFTQTKSGLSAPGDVKFNVGTSGGLTRGATYFYLLTTTSSDSSEVITNRGSFVAAKTTPDWFVATSDTTKGGMWDNTPEWTSGTTTIATSNAFAVTATQSGNIVVVETSVRYTCAVDEDDFVELVDSSEVQGAIVAATNSINGGEMAWFGVDGRTWRKLSGAVPSLNVDYTIRTEFDYARGKVRYLVANDGDFTCLQAGEKDWFDIAIDGETVKALDKIDLIGSGELSGIIGSCANANQAKVGATEYETFDNAIAAANGGIVELQTSICWTPAGDGVFRIDRNACDFMLSQPSRHVKYSDGLLRVTTGDEAAINETTYGFLEDAFADVSAADTTIQLLKNVTYYAALTAATVSVTLDTAGFNLLNGFETGVDLTIPEGGRLIFTNSAPVAGYINANIVGTRNYFIAGGKWAAALTEDHLLNSEFAVYPIDPTYVQHDVLINAQVVYNDPTKGLPSATDAKIVPMVNVDATTGKTNIQSDVVVSNDFISTYCTDTTKSISEQLNAQRLRGSQSNGATLLESYVLGLNPQDENSLPIIEKEKDQATGVTLALGNVKVNETSGVPVKFALESASRPDFSDSTIGSKSSVPSFAVELKNDTSGNKVQYHRIRIYIGE